MINDQIPNFWMTYLLLRLQDTNPLFPFPSPCSSLGLFHGKRNFSCSPERNPAILGEHVTALSCSPENSPFFPFSLGLVAQCLPSLQSPARFSCLSRNMTDSANRAQLVEQLRRATFRLAAVWHCSVSLCGVTCGWRRTRARATGIHLGSKHEWKSDSRMFGFFVFAWNFSRFSRCAIKLSSFINARSHFTVNNSSSDNLERAPRWRQQVHYARRFLCTQSLQTFPLRVDLTVCMFCSWIAGSDS